MSNQILVQYVGFQVKPLVREYTFAVRETATEPLQYTVTIANEAFVSHRTRYQDAPGICSLSLHRELETHANHPPTTNFCVTDAELAVYQNTRQNPIAAFTSVGTTRHLAVAPARIRPNGATLAAAD